MYLSALSASSSFTNMSLIDSPPKSKPPTFAKFRGVLISKFAAFAAFGFALSNPLGGGAGECAGWMLAFLEADSLRLRDRRLLGGGSSHICQRIILLKCLSSFLFLF